MNKLNKNPDKEQPETTNPSTIDEAVRKAYRDGFKDGFHEADQLIEVENDEPSDNE